MFFTRVEQLNSFVSLLPCLYNSPRATPAMKPVVPFNEAELANLLLCMCPDSWQNQYNLNQDTIPQDSRRLLIVLENIEKLGVTMVPQKPPANGNGNAKSNGKESNGKRKGTDSSTGQSHKKSERISIVSCARSTAESPPCTTQATVPSTRKITQFSRRGAVVSTSPTRLKKGRKVISTRNLRIESSRKWTRSLRKLSSPCRGTATGHDPSRASHSLDAV
jgi:hypothetical protein